MAQKERGDIDAEYHAIRARLKNFGTGGSPSLTVPPHTHSADQITYNPGAETIAGDDVQEVGDELGIEKLARDGSQTMLGDLPMNAFAINIVKNIHMDAAMGQAIIDGLHALTFDATAVGEADITSVRDISFAGIVGEGVIQCPRVIHMCGDHVDDEAKIDGLERAVFNNEPTASSIEMPSRLEMNIGVTAGSSYTAGEGKLSWDTLEDAMIMYVASGAGLVAVALGWAVMQAMNGYNQV